MNQNDTTFIAQFDLMAKEVHKTATNKGWWEARENIVEACKCISPALGEAAEANIKLAAQMLVCSEIGEATDGIRKPELRDDKIPKFSAEEAELADAVIRIMDYSARYGCRVAEAIVAKNEMNKGRAYMHGGKLA